MDFTNSGNVTVTSGTMTISSNGSHPGYFQSHGTLLFNGNNVILG